MKKYINYFWYLAKHKWYVLIAGLKLKVPLWQLLIHDYTKLFPSILRAYSDSQVYGYNYKNWPEEARNRFDWASLQHTRWEKHHFQNYIVIFDSGCQKALEIPDNYLRELVADWNSAGKAKTGKWDAKPWYYKNPNRFLLHPNTRRKLEELLEKF